MKSLSLRSSTTECIGLATEKILCDIFKIQFNTKRKNPVIYDKNMYKSISELQILNNLKIIEHTGNLNNYYDFLDDEKKTVSIKTNITGNKICPQIIGQTTLQKFSEKYNSKAILSKQDYKRTVFDETHKILLFYLENLFLCDKTIHFQYNIGKVNYFEKTGAIKLVLNTELITFSKSEIEWNESNTLYIAGLPLCEFQVHNNRNCVKCRFNTDTVVSCILSDIISGISINTLEMDTKFSITTKPEKTFTSFNYIGSKYNLLDFIMINIQGYTGKTIEELSTVGDFFAGSGVVSQRFLKEGAEVVVSSDNQNYSYVVSSVLLDKEIDKTKVKKYIKAMNDIDISDKPVTALDFIYNEYSINRQYYTPGNGLKIDRMRQYLESVKESLTLNEFNLLLKTLLYAASKCANIASVFGAFLKNPKASFLKEIILEELFVDNLLGGTGKQHSCFWSSINKMVKYSKSLNVMYLDPPYNQRNYSSNYHLLETISLYDYPEIKGKTGLRVNDTEDAKIFCSKRAANFEFENTIASILSKYLFISYNSEGILSKEEMVEILEKTRRNVVVYEKTYKKFNSNKINSDSVVIEYLFCSVLK